MTSKERAARGQEKQAEINRLKKELGVVEEVYKHHKFVDANHELNYLRRQRLIKRQVYLHNLTEGRTE